MSTQDDPLKRVRRELDTPVTQKISSALVALILVLAFQPSAPVQAHEGLVVIQRAGIDYVTKPTITLTKVTPEPVQVKKKSIQVKERYTKVSTVSNKGAYSYGYCTWFVASVRDDIPAGLGNANTWLARAKSKGLATGRTPAIGAVIQTSEGRIGHVAVVVGVTENSLTIREANYKGWNVVSTRTISASAPYIVGYIYAP